ncbi:MAG: 30S ribosomal protein S6 [Candidatus Omnitrophica bacterium]|nr:30S ribosomal protein S6 [Candidatus Omnitrophota bacterium]
MNNYEAIFIIKSDKEENIEKAINQITKNVTDNKGKVLKTEKWGNKRLAYPIKKHKEGAYIKLNFSLDPLQVVKLDKACKLISGILRALIIKK